MDGKQKITYGLIAVAVVIVVYFSVKYIKKQGIKSAVTYAKQIYSQFSGVIETDARLNSFLYKIWRHVGWGDTWAKKAIAERTAWSAAFISYLYRNYSDFPKSASHSNYIVTARNNSKNNTGNFRLRRIDQYKPQEGDIVCMNRGGNNFTYDTIYAGAISHCDTVISVSSSRIVTIGGNVSNQIKKNTVLTRNGYLYGSGFFAIIENRHNF